MPNMSAYILGDDLPKDNPWQDDLLGFRPFTERLSKVLANLKAPNGYVVGLHGEWGSGKSTALNFIRAFLNKHNQESGSNGAHVAIIDFRPWIVSRHQDLIATFFKVMSETLATKSSWPRRQMRRLLRLCKIATDPLVNSIATVAVTLDPSAGFASGTVAAVTKGSLGGLIDKFLAEPSLQTAYDELKMSLQKSEKRFLVIIDDLDRLQNDEIRAIMQMVKTVGKLPNVIYLLAYDRAILWKVLDNEDGRPGPRFAEKIVQQELELPRPSKSSLLSILDAEIGFLPRADVNSARWHYILRDGIHRWIRNPRDVVRLANSVKFSWPALQGEIDPQDLLAMEGLRLFEPKAFDWIRWDQDFLFTSGRFVLADEALRERAVRGLKERLPDKSCNEVLRVVSALFPSQAKWLEGKNALSGEAQAEVMKRRGIGCEAGYDAYFGLHPSSDAISKAVVDNVVAALRDEEELAVVFQHYVEKKDLRGRAMIGPLIEELRCRFYGRKHETPTHELLNALFRVGEPILDLDWEEDILTSSPRTLISFLIRDLLELWGPDEEPRSQRLGRRPLGQVSSLIALVSLELLIPTPGSHQ